MKSIMFSLIIVAIPAIAFGLGAVAPNERATPIGAVQDLGGFVGLDIDRYVGMLEKHDTTGWFWIGEQPGKWLESAILTAKAQKDLRLEARAREVLARMIKAQQPDGYLGITASSVRTAQIPLRGMDPYEQYFTFHALLTAYEVWGDKAALAAATKLGDYYLQHIASDKAQFWPSPIRPPENTNTIITPQATSMPIETPRAAKMYSHSEIAGHTAHYGRMALS